MDDKRKLWLKSQNIPTNKLNNRPDQWIIDMITWLCIDFILTVKQYCLQIARKKILQQIGIEIEAENLLTLRMEPISATYIRSVSSNSARTWPRFDLRDSMSCKHTWTSAEWKWWLVAIARKMKDTWRFTYTLSLNVMLRWVITIWTRYCVSV